MPDNLLNGSINGLQPGQKPTSFRLWQVIQMASSELGVTANSGQMGMDDMLQGSG